MFGGRVLGNTTSVVNDDDVAAQGYSAIMLLVFCIIILCLAFLGFWLEKNKVSIISESGSAMVIGMVVGGILNAVSDGEATRYEFKDDFFFYTLLPPIILEAGFSMKAKNFFSNFGTIALLAVVGTIIATFVTGYLLSLTGVLGTMECYIYAALISAVDPVSTLSVFKKVKAPSKLFNVVFGESVLNDAVAIVLYGIFHDFAKSNETLTAGSGIVAILKLFGIALGSLLLAAVFSLGTAYCLKKAENSLKDFPLYEITAILVTNYICYVVANLCELSGIVAVFFSGILTSHYTVNTVSEAARVTVAHVLEVFAFVAENFLFVYLGVAVAAYGKNFVWNWSFIWINIVVLLVARACNTFPLIFMANLFRKKALPLKYTFMIWFAGLRGAIAFALALSYEDEGYKIIRGTTLFTVLFTTLVLGVATAPLLKMLRLTGIHSAMDERDEDGGDDHTHLRHVLQQDDDGREAHEHHPRASPKDYGGFHGWWHDFDLLYMKPLFGAPEDRETVRQTSQVQMQSFGASQLGTRVANPYNQM